MWNDHLKGKKKKSSSKKQWYTNQYILFLFSLECIIVFQGFFFRKGIVIGT